MECIIDEESYAENNVVVITIKGSLLGGPKSKKLPDALYDLKERNKTNVVLDLSKIRFINAAGMGFIISGLTLMRNSSGDLRLASISERSKTMFVITNLLSTFTHKESVEDAVLSFVESPPIYRELDSEE